LSNALKSIGMASLGHIAMCATGGTSAFSKRVGAEAATRGGVLRISARTVLPIRGIFPFRIPGPWPFRVDLIEVFDSKP